jgi:CspA family cold shock protein
MPTGRIKFFDPIRGFVFIQPDDGGDDLFVHKNSFLEEGVIPARSARVHFDVANDCRRNKLQAVGVRLCEDHVG